jgi:hypothetical protein
MKQLQIKSMKAINQPVILLFSNREGKKNNWIRHRVHLFKVKKNDFVLKKSRDSSVEILKKNLKLLSVCLLS